MKLYYILFIINVSIYLSEYYKSQQSCNECYTENLCFWLNNTCKKSINTSQNNNKNSYLTSLYKCIENYYDAIKIYHNTNNETITLSSTDKSNKNDINYKIYCFEYQSLKNLIIKITYYDFEKNIKEILLYDGFTNKEIPLSNNIYYINLVSNFTCVKIAYLLQNSNIKNILTIKLSTNENDSINLHDIIINYNYPQFLQSFCLLICILLLIFILIATFIICNWKKQKKTIESVIVINNFKINNDNNIETIPNNKEKYMHLKQDSFLENNGNNINSNQSLSSFANDIKNSPHKEIILKSIINTIHSFFVSFNNKDLIGVKCKFCESKLKFGDKICLLNCGHLFHYECLYQQIIINEVYRCILCKKNIII